MPTLLYTKAERNWEGRFNLVLGRIYNVPKRGPKKLWREPCISWQFVTIQIQDAYMSTPSPNKQTNKSQKEGKEH